MHNPFSIELSKIIVKSLFNDYKDNHDTYRFGPSQDAPENSLRLWIRKRLNSKGYYSVPSVMDYVNQSLEAYNGTIAYFEYLYNLLEDDYSRSLLVRYAPLGC
jgi:hypothetical protein